jgi:hypothetical protein
VPPRSLSLPLSPFSPLAATRASRRHGPHVRTRKGYVLLGAALPPGGPRLGQDDRAGGGGADRERRQEGHAAVEDRRGTSRRARCAACPRRHRRQGPAPAQGPRARAGGAREPLLPHQEGRRHQEAPGQEQDRRGHQVPPHPCREQGPPPRPLLPPRQEDPFLLEVGVHHRERSGGVS